MSRRKNTWIPVMDIEVEDLINDHGDVAVVVYRDVNERGGHILAYCLDGSGSIGISFDPAEEFFVCVPRHHKPMFPGSRSDLLTKLAPHWEARKALEGA